MAYQGDAASEVGDDLFRGQAEPMNVPGGASGGGGEMYDRGGVDPRMGGRGKRGGSALESADASVGHGWGRGPMPPDPRKYKYDVHRATASPALTFSASKSDRMDAADAGDLLDRIHKAFGIDRETENRIHAFNNALFLEHTLNGASLLQPGRGTLKVDRMQFDVQVVKKILGVDQRRFFRAFADDIAEVNRKILNEFDPMDPESVEIHGQMNQIAVERGMLKFPYLIHDSADAAVMLSNDERNALIASKRFMLHANVNNVDKMPTYDDAKAQRDSGIVDN